MKLYNPELTQRGLSELERTVTAPNGKNYLFGPDGLCEVDDDCGLNLVPPFVVKEGVPALAEVAAGKSVAPEPVDGPLVEIFAPLEMVGQSVSCPDGRTVLIFGRRGQQAVATGPDTCGIFAVPGYTKGRSLEAPAPAPKKARKTEPEEAPPASATEEDALPQEEETPPAEEGDAPKKLTAKDRKLAAQQAALAMQQEG